MRGRFKTVLLVALAGAAVVLGALAGRIAPSSEETALTFLAIGQADCAVFQTDGRTILIDVGSPRGRKDTGERVIARKLRELGVTRIDMALLSHPDTDHVAGLPGLAGRIPIERVVVPASFRDHPQFAEVFAAARIKSSQLVWIDEPARTRIGNFDLYIHCPPWREGEPDNEGSMFVKLSAGAASVVFTGDAGIVTEARLLGRADWRAQILKAGHHGSRNSTGTQWLRAVRPEWVVFSCGRDNSYGHPHPDVLARVEGAGAQAARTDLEGDVRFVLEGGRFVRQYAPVTTK